MPTTAAIAKVTTGTAVKTMMQLQAAALNTFKVKGWGIDFDGIAAATPIECELIETGTVAATVTAYVAADIYPYENATGEASILQLGTTASGFTSTGEGTITVSRVADYRLVAPTNQYNYDWVLGNEFQVAKGAVCRVRVTAAAAVNAVCYMIIEQ